MKSSEQREILKGNLGPVDSGDKCREFFTYKPHPPAVMFSEVGRLINHFCLGADPEFIFTTPGMDQQIPAAQLMLKPGLAFGADQNDRLVELRPAASRSAVHVLGSILAELRWLYRYTEEYKRMTGTSDILWVASAFQFGDGMGGHVHFGRKRPNREVEIAGLDGLAKVLRTLGLFDSKGWDKRTAGDQFHQLYGRYGDTRVQKHGYEYRTLPTWLDSPDMAFLVLVLSKLVLVDPDLCAGWDERRADWSLVQGLAKYYKGRDDDALLLYSLLESPKRFAYIGGDFRKRWGLTGVVAKVDLTNTVWPTTMSPTSADLQDLRQHFQGKPLEMREQPPNWTELLPKNYLWIPARMEYRRRPNIADIFSDLVEHKSMHITWEFDHGDCSIGVPPHIKIPPLKKIAGDIQVHHNSGYYVRVPQEWRRGPRLEKLRKVLRSGLLPLWTAETVTAESHLSFQPKHHKPKHRYHQLVTREI